MRQASEKIRAMLEPAVIALGYELVGIDLVPQGRRATLRIYIDAPHGIGLDDCERVSHQVSGILDVHDPIRGEYALEVSSPGMDRPLFKAEHFVRFAGQRVKLRLRVPQDDGRRTVVGVLVGLVESNVVVNEDAKHVTLPLEGIESARLVPDYAASLTRGGHLADRSRAQSDE